MLTGGLVLSVLIIKIALYTYYGIIKGSFSILLGLAASCIMHGIDVLVDLSRLLLYK